ncbi:hypothetical protein AB4Z54_68705, partial [Streptomyces sp. MCAF7]
GIVGSAAAIANAFHHATGVRVRDLPIRIERSREALRAMRGLAMRDGAMRDGAGENRTDIR